MRNKVKIILFMVALVLGFSVKIDYLLIDQGNIVKERELQYESIINYPKMSGYWDLPFIHIDGNWSYTAGNYTWCRGDGSWQNPYVIENVTVDASSSPTGSGILIENSKQNYFIIRNCTIFNAGTGIKLENSTNGRLTENNCSFNSYGIWLYNYCVNDTIIGNTINDNIWGILVNTEIHNESSRVFILENTVNRNADGILIGRCSNSTISRNSINWNSDFGIYLEGTGDTIVSDNFITFNDHGIWLEISHRNTISGNVISNNTKSGITLKYFCDNNSIVGNLIYDNQIGIWNTNTGPDNEANQMFHNYLAQGLVGVNARDQVIEFWGNVWYNSRGGNYWDDYTGVDANGDGIGDSFYYIRFQGYESVDRRPLMNYPAFFSEKPDNLTFEIGTTNHYLNWTVVHPNPLSYTVLRNGTSVKSGILSSQIEDIGIVVDDLSEGDHLFTLEVEHEVIGRTSSDNVTVKVINTLPVFSQKPGNRSYEQGQNGNLLSWAFSDVSTNNSRYAIYRDGFLVITDNPCVPGVAIDLNIDGLFTGVYVFTIEIEDGYGGTVQDVIWVGVTSSLYIEIVDQLFTAEEFNITYLLFNENDQGIDFATTQTWWNGTDVSTSVQILGGGIYFISLDPITVAPGEDPILLKIVVSAFGYAEKSFETYIAVDPETLTKGEDTTPDELPIIVIAITTGSTIGTLAIVGVIIALLRRRK